ncbi:MAG: T9SS type A sorting domain-containing protein [Bacteroides sp.]|nr:T9SS type A sorting domain-containing protein [Roseburia sp.]MCM1346540.1 T9SS type A sorting domain-containing protein [Bacteroides sp.]MCM1421097.1 T9SS type A sorting domain-containing protein [Bacteroides sp.]
MRKKMQLAALLCAAFVFSPNSVSADDYDLYLLSSEGEYVSLDYSTLRSLEFARVREDEAYVNKMFVNRVDGTSDEFNLLTYDALLFESVATSIGHLQEEIGGQVLEWTGGTVRCLVGGEVKVYQVDGRLIKTLSVESGDSFTLDTLAAGTYIIHINGKSVKVQKR